MQVQGAWPCEASGSTSRAGTEGALSACDFALWNLLIRPPRSSYDSRQLGPTEFTVGGVVAVRRDIRIRTKRGSKLACSHFVPRQVQGVEGLQKSPVIIYLHGNSSSRLEATSVLHAVIAQRISLFCFDAAGCGHSEGEYISLGWHEREDLAAVITYLRRSPFCGPIGLWGRSMGAVTALLYADRDPGLGALCLDSPFASLRALAEELTRTSFLAFPVPSWLIGVVFALIRLRIKMLANFDVEDIMPLEHAKRSFVPAFFMHGKHDTFILPRHSRDIYNAYAGDKQFVPVEGDHNTERSPSATQRAVEFFKRAFRLGEVDLVVAPEQLSCYLPGLPLGEVSLPRPGAGGSSAMLGSPPRLAEAAARKEPPTPATAPRTNSRRQAEAGAPPSGCGVSLSGTMLEASAIMAV